MTTAQPNSSLLNSLHSDMMARNIQNVIINSCGDQIQVDVSIYTNLTDVFSFVASQKSVDLEACRFLLNGERIGKNATVETLGLTGKECIDMFMVQQGGVGGGHVRMPHNNRVSSSASMKMTDIWTNTIKYDPYALDGELKNKEEGKAETMERAKGIMALAKISSAQQGNSERSTDFARQVFWGLKRREPPKGYEVPVLSDEGSSDSDDDSDDDSDKNSDAEGAAAAAAASSKRQRSPSSSPERERKSSKKSSSDDRERKSSKKSKSKKEKKEKKEKKHKKHKKKHHRKHSSRSDSD
jgi:hypothetical protein